MGCLRWLGGAGLMSGAWLVFLLSSGARGQQILQYGFEARDPVWVQGTWDAPYKEVSHRLTDETAHGGLRSEHVRVQAEKGSHIHYTYDVGKAPITDELHLSLWIKANRPNVQLLCRVVLPRERDPNKVGEPLRFLLRCEPYQSARWKMITLRQPVKRLKEQQQLLRHQLGRDVVIDEAYVDQLVLNVYDGPGLTDVYIDDLEIGPVFDLRPPGAAIPATGPRAGVPASPAVNRRAAAVELKGNHLMVSGQRFFLRGIRHTGTPLKTLRDAGFNTVWVDESTPSAVIEDAVNLGFWLVPSLAAPSDLRAGGKLTGQLTSSNQFARNVARFLEQDAVLCWDLGSNLDTRGFPEVARVARAFRATDPMRPLAADVWDGFRSYSSSLEDVMLGAHRWPLMTSLELSSYRDWLVQRRRLAAPNTYCWTWVQTHLPDGFLRVAYDEKAPAPKEALGPQAEQVRLLAYVALGCGYRGLAFWSDRFLADSHAGRDRLLGLALLNQELQMLEPLLVKATREPIWVPTSQPEVSAAIIHLPGAVLVLPIWIGGGAQYVPPQAAVAELLVTVPAVPDSAQAWEVSPGRVQSYRVERVLGGMRLRLHNFSLTSAVVFTSDLEPTGLVVRLQDQQRRMGKIAAQWAQDQAQEELTKVEQVHAELVKVAPALPDAEPILKRAHLALDRCAEHRRNGEHTNAYGEAQVALRAVRVLMRAHWDRAVRDLDVPVSSPYACSFYTLPRHWRFVDEITKRSWGANLLKDGGFEAPPEVVQPGWQVQELTGTDAVVPVARRVADGAKEGKQCLMLRVTARTPLLSPQALESTYLAIHSPAVRLEPGTPVRISAWVKVSGGIGVSPDGAMLYDSAGGEPLAIRLIGQTRDRAARPPSVPRTGKQGARPPDPPKNVEWQKFTVYRRVPASGEVRVTMALTGLGTVYFDDLRIEPLVAGATTTAPTRATVMPASHSVPAR